MRRYLIAMVLAGAVGAGSYAVVGDDAGRSAAAPVVSYPRSVAPLPVPEIVIGEQPWTDPLPTVPAPVPLRKGAGLPEVHALRDRPALPAAAAADLPERLEHLFDQTYAAGVNPNGSVNGRPLAAADPYAVDVPQTPPVYHVWVNLSNLTTQVAQEYPGLVIGWRRTSDGYEAQVVYVVPSRTQRHSDASQIAWLPASKLKPRT